MYNNGAAADITSGEPHIDIEGTAATARIEIDNWIGHRFTDFFTPVKVGGRWQILSKVFYLQAARIGTRSVLHPTEGS